MSKKIILALVFFIFFFGFKFVQADVFINEVELNPTTGRFIELYNGGSADVDLTNWYIQRKTATGSDFGSLISKTYFENKMINAGGYFLISRTALPNADIVLGSMTLTESNAIQIKNGEGNVVDKIGWGTTGEFSVAENPPDDKSIQKINGDWVVASPTPRAQNTSSSSNSDDSSDSSQSDSNSDSSNSADDSADNSSNSISGGGGADGSLSAKKGLTIKTKILTKNVAFAGQPLEIETNVLGYKNETIMCGKYFWNFGDGDSKENDSSTKFTHTYLYPGEYNISLEYYLNQYSQISDATSSLTIKVVPTEVSISKVGDVKDFFVELTNNSPFSVDISRWWLKANGKIFIFPKNTIILPKNPMTVSSRLTGFVLGDQNDLKLFSSIADIVFDYNEPAQNKIIPQKIENNIKEITTKSVSDILPRDMVPTIPAENNNLAAAVLLGNTPAQNNLKNSFLPYGMFGILLLGSGGAAYFVRRKKNALKFEDGDDFEILDE